MDNKLMEIKVDMKKIAVNIAFRMIYFIAGAMACFMAEVQHKNTNHIIMIAVMAVLLAYALSPLLHIKDVLVYYENKIVLKKQEINFNHPSEIKWKKSNSYIFLTRFKIYKESNERGLKAFLFDSDNEIDVTYMRNPKDEFINCYLNRN